MRVQVQLESTFTFDFGSVRNHVRNVVIFLYNKLGCQHSCYVCSDHALTMCSFSSYSPVCCAVVTVNPGVPSLLWRVSGHSHGAMVSVLHSLCSLRARCWFSVQTLGQHCKRGKESWEFDVVNSLVLRQLTNLLQGWWFNRLATKVVPTSWYQVVFTLLVRSLVITFCMIDNSTDSQSATKFFLTSWYQVVFALLVPSLLTTLLYTCYEIFTSVFDWSGIELTSNWIIST